MQNISPIDNYSITPLFKLPFYSCAPEVLPFAIILKFDFFHLIFLMVLLHYSKFHETDVFKR
jgi:hypothetical protein